MAKAKGDADKSVNKMKLVREALQQAPDTTPQGLQAYIRDTHKVEMGTQMISSYKSTIKKKEGGGASSGGRGGVEGSVPLRDIATLRDMIDRVGTAQVQAIIKVLGK